MASRLPIFGGGQRGVTIAIDDTEVLNTIEAVWNSVSGPSLESFLENRAAPEMLRKINNRFQFQGDAQVGHWEPLTESTVEIKDNLPFVDDPEWANVRTGDFMEWVTAQPHAHQGSFSAEMSIPDDSGDDLLQKKMKTAQQGTSSNPMIPGAVTPARPVLWADEADLEQLLVLLAEHIIIQVGIGAGASELTINPNRGSGRSFAL